MKKIIALLIGLSLLATMSVSQARTRYGQAFCDDPNFTCIRIKGGQSWKKLWPDAYQQQIVKRLNRMNVRLRSGMIIAVPNDLANVNIMDISPFPHVIDAPGEKMVVVDPEVFAFGAYDAQGNLVHWGPMSGGKGWCSDIGRKCVTVSGQFNFFNKKGPDCYSRAFPVGSGGAPMPHCMYFFRGYALHASKEVPGYHASHGCVRLFKEDAQWLNEEFVDMPHETNTGKGTRVIVNPYSI